MQLGYVHYGYLDDNDAGYDYDEVNASISYQQRATASIAWSPNTSKHTYWGFISEKRALAYELSLLQPLDPRWSLCAGVGYYDLSDLVDTGYWYWSTGVAFTGRACRSTCCTSTRIPRPDGCSTAAAAGRRP